MEGLFIDRGNWTEIIDRSRTHQPKPPLEDEVKTLSFQNKEQKSDWYLRLNPNGRVPTLIDHSNNDFSVWESSAILLYIAQHFDPEHKISYDPVSEPKLYSEQLQWLFFAHGGLGPMQGQAVHFTRLAPQEVPYAIKRYRDESIRLTSILEERLKGREWLVGTHYSVADIKTVLWIRVAPVVKVDLNDFPNVKKWLERILSRPKTQKGLTVPEPLDIEFLTNGPIENTRAFGTALFGFKKVEE
ncbi:hypothetical protein Clacol_005672 [Clathrus columnatus]|uniref:Glutathione S-transferase n=1 Tax=Clathrus columnatus TaxID=1419009 RepID=A0AAV5AFG9_9AGAM|nr:hypothetical protein Clacol_005672 [Clathrus columnatus]